MPASDNLDTERFWGVLGGFCPLSTLPEHYTITTRSHLLNVLKAAVCKFVIPQPWENKKGLLQPGIRAGRPPHHPSLPNIFSSVLSIHHPPLSPRPPVALAPHLSHVNQHREKG
ncbi:hypothetical protein DPEC_G00255870 [Dallia pectoralis]|uniref:Uncharacterized protein n=1 Tax=Dallia pectoralis TaxID=75939 RepID=A0ACC2FUM5_DALPE|nr:hypothetical protein DPEC_G00255870 [Dallia pectoralis]